MVKTKHIQNLIIISGKPITPIELVFEFQNAYSWHTSGNTRLYGTRDDEVR